MVDLTSLIIIGGVVYYYTQQQKKKKEESNLSGENLDNNDDYDDYDEYDEYDDYDEYDGTEETNGQDSEEQTEKSCPYDERYDKGTEECKCKANTYDLKKDSPYCRCLYGFSGSGDPDSLPETHIECECMITPTTKKCVEHSESKKSIAGDMAETAKRTGVAASCLVGAQTEQCPCETPEDPAACKGQQALETIGGAVGTIMSPYTAATDAVGQFLDPDPPPTYEGGQEMIDKAKSGNLSSEDIEAISVSGSALSGNIKDKNLQTAVSVGTMVGMFVLPPAGMVASLMFAAVNSIVDAVDPYGYNTIISKEHVMDKVYTDIEESLINNTYDITAQCERSSGCDFEKSDTGGENCDIDLYDSCWTYMPKRKNSEDVSPTYEFYPKPPYPYCNPDTDGECEESDIYDNALESYANENLKYYLDEGMDPSYVEEYKNEDSALKYASDAEKGPLKKDNMKIILPAIALLLVLK